MNNQVLKFGCWISLIAIATFICYTSCFIAISVVNPLFIWTNFENYLKTVQSSNQIFKHIAMLAMIVYSICFVLQLCGIEEIAELQKKYYAKIAVLFGLGFCILICINYFIQLSTVRMQINIHQTNGLEQFIMSNPLSGVAAINMLGWTIFFGLSTLFAALVFGNTKIERKIKFIFLLNGITMLIVAVAYLLNVVIVVFLGIYIELGMAMLLSSVYHYKLFKNSQVTYLGN